MWPYTCLFNDGHGICEATGTPCIDGPDCIEHVPPGSFPLVSRGEVEEAFILLGFHGKPEPMRHYAAPSGEGRPALPDIDIDE